MERLNYRIIRMGSAHFLILLLVCAISVRSLFDFFFIVVSRPFPLDGYVRLSLRIVEPLKIKYQEQKLATYCRNMRKGYCSDREGAVIWILLPWLQWKPNLLSQNG